MEVTMCRCELQTWAQLHGRSYHVENLLSAKSVGTSHPMIPVAVPADLALSNFSMC